MSVTLADVENIARLARLSFSQEEMITFTGQFNQILQYMDKLNELDTSNVEPTLHVLDTGNPLRQDEQKTWLTQEQALANAPRGKNGFFSVPRMIG